MKKKPSLKPIRINADTWFYESEKSLHFVAWVTEPHSGNRVCASFKVPWRKIAKSYPALTESGGQAMSLTVLLVIIGTSGGVVTVPMPDLTICARQAAAVRWSKYADAVCITSLDAEDKP